MQRNPLRLPLYVQTLIGMLLGIAVGMYFGASAEWLGKFSKYVIDLIKFVAMPLLFFAILDAVGSAAIKGRGVLTMLLICTCNGLCAVAIALCISNLFRPGTYLTLPREAVRVNGEKFLNGLDRVVGKSDVASFFSGTTLAISLGLFFGLLFLLLKKLLIERRAALIERAESAIKRILDLLFALIGYIALLIPFAVFSAVVKVTAQHGFTLIAGLSVYFLSCLLGMVLQILVVYQTWIRVIAKIPLSRFWKEAREPVVHAFGINSSLATLPMTLQALKRLGVSDSSSRLGACVGTNLNNDGILLYEVVASLFMAQAYGLDLSIWHQFVLTIVCIFATIGVAGVPEAGMISLSLVVSAMGLPLESLPLLLSVDWVLGRCRSINNVLGDMTVSIGIDHFRAQVQKDAQALSVG